MNSLYNQLNRSNINKPPLQIPNNVKNIINMLKFAKDPQGMADKMVQDDPQLQAVIGAANGNYQKAFELKAQELGVNPNDILDLLR